MKFILEIEVGNTSMQTYADICEALQRDLSTLGTSSLVVQNRDHSLIRDINGNVVGKWEVAQ